LWCGPGAEPLAPQRLCWPLLGRISLVWARESASGATAAPLPTFDQNGGLPCSPERHNAQNMVLRPVETPSLLRTTRDAGRAELVQLRTQSAVVYDWDCVKRCQIWLFNLLTPNACSLLKPLGRVRQCGYSQPPLAQRCCEFAARHRPAQPHNRCVGAVRLHLTSLQASRVAAGVDNGLCRLPRIETPQARAPCAVTW
jgi:hypothetical protein